MILLFRYICKSWLAESILIVFRGEPELDHLDTILLHPHHPAINVGAYLKTLKR
jgi:hypothetical protein